MSTELLTLPQIEEFQDELGNEVKLVLQIDDLSSRETGLNEIKNKYLGNKGLISSYQRQMGKIVPEERREYGQKLNALRQMVERVINTAHTQLSAAKLQRQIDTEELDLTLPGLQANNTGNLHPLTMITDEIVDIFGQMGFSLHCSPEIETEHRNFTALNIPASHPARDEQDTFYVQGPAGLDEKAIDHVILRSQVSPAQIHLLEAGEMPIRAISWGRVYRNEETNARKMPFFHQLEILCVDEGIQFGHLKWTLENFFRLFFGKDILIRMRPDFFPFTEPSCEVDAQCPFCQGRGCMTCGQRGWLELLGCGMVDPNVLLTSRVDSKKYSGFAAGLGIERLAMIKYGIADIRDFYTSDLRFSID